MALRMHQDSVYVFATRVAKSLNPKYQKTQLKSQTLNAIFEVLDPAREFQNMKDHATDSPNHFDPA